MQGRLKRSPGYHVPIYAMPSDAVMLNPNEFNSSTHRQKWIGQREHHWIHPYPRLSRYEINRHGLPRARILAWCKYRADRLFLMLQGSGRIKLPHHHNLLLGYDGENCKHNILIGNIMLHEHIMPRNKISLYTIRKWLIHHPHQGRRLMDKNPAFVFFKRLSGQAPKGANELALTPRASLAVDPRYIPLNSPIWLSTNLPNNKHWHHLMVSQDTGGAIRGVIRGDIYWGASKHAQRMASTMDEVGTYTLLLPKTIHKKTRHLKQTLSKD
jgi:Membrane-bound lytic murein transglycosylase